MYEWETLEAIAIEAGCPELIRAARQRKEALLCQEKLKLVVTGIRGSGKTTLINRMVGLEVWPAGNMDEHEKPLRVVFEPTEEDKRYNCLMAVNREWNGRDAVLYELREENIFDGIQLTEEMDDKDVVLFLVSALAPFSRTEVDMLKALFPLHRQVILTNLPMVREDNREKVREYAEKMNAALGLPALVVLEEQDIGREIRNLLPGFQELPALREAHAQQLREKAARQLAKRIEAAIRENTEQMAQADNRDEAIRGNQEQLSWTTLKIDLEGRAQKAVRELMGDPSREADAMAAAMVKNGQKSGFDEAWRKRLEQEVSRELDRVYGNRTKRLVQQAAQDIHKAAEDALFLRLHGFRDEDFRRLEQDVQAADLMPKVMDCAKKALSLSEQKKSVLPEGSKRLLASTCAVLGGFAVAPIPKHLRVVGGLSTLGVMGGVYLNKQNEEWKKSIYDALRRNFQEMLSCAERELRGAADELYRPTITYLEERCAASAPVPVDLTPFQTRDQTLRRLLETCHGQISE